jgi:hypothetical protein
MTQADRVHSTPPTNTSAIDIMRVWTSVTSEGTRLKREQLADEISHIPDEQLRANLRHTMSRLFLSSKAILSGVGAAKRSRAQDGGDGDDIHKCSIPGRSLHRPRPGPSVTERLRRSATASRS